MTTPLERAADNYMKREFGHGLDQGEVGAYWIECVREDMTAALDRDEIAYVIAESICGEVRENWDVPLDDDYRKAADAVIAHLLGRTPGETGGVGR